MPVSEKKVASEPLTQFYAIWSTLNDFVSSASFFFFLHISISNQSAIFYDTTVEWRKEERRASERSRVEKGRKKNTKRDIWFSMLKDDDDYAMTRTRNYVYCHFLLLSTRLSFFFFSSKNTLCFNAFFVCV